MPETIKIRCLDCGEIGDEWWRVYIPLIQLVAGEFNLVDVVEDRAFIQASDPEAMGGIMNHHNTTRIFSRGHGRFSVLDSDNNQIGFLTVSKHSQRLNTEHFNK